MGKLTKRKAKTFLLVVLLFMEFQTSIFLLETSAQNGVLAVSSKTITVTTGKVVMVTISGLEDSASEPPIVYCNWPLQLNGNISITLSRLPMYQAENGVWIGFIAVDIPSDDVPAASPSQDSTPPKNDTANFVRVDEMLDDPGKEPDMSYYTANYITAIALYANFSGATVELTYGNEIVTIEVVAGTVGTISFDRERYPPTRVGEHYGRYPIVYITIKDEDWNLDPTILDLLDPANVTLTGITLPPSVSPLFETDVNSGEFLGVAILGPPRMAEASWGELLKGEYRDVVDYTVGRYKVRKAYALIISTTGKISLDKAEYVIHDNITVTLEEPDLNMNSKLPETVYVNITSKTDPRGFVLLLKETGENTGIFKGNFVFNLEYTNPMEKTIKVWYRDRIYVTYFDVMSKVGLNTTIQAIATIVANTGSVRWTKDPEYGATELAVVEVIDPDLDTNILHPDVVKGGEVYPKPVIPGKVYVWSSTEPDKYYTLTMIETNKTTGVFIGYVKFSTEKGKVGDVPTLKVKPSCSLKVIYFDAVDGSGSPRKIVAKAWMRSHTGEISLDRQIYPPGRGTVSGLRDVKGAWVKITLKDLDLNIEPEAQDYVSKKLVKVRVVRDGEVVYEEEIGNLFKEHVNLTVVQANVTEAEINVTKAKIVSGVFHAKWRIPSLAKRGDVLEIIYFDQSDDTGLAQRRVVKARIMSHTGRVEVSPSTVAIYENLTVRVYDEDWNLDPEVAETIPADLDTWGGVEVYSLTPNLRTIMGKAKLELRETGPNTGIFEANLTVGCDYLYVDAGQVKPGYILKFVYNDDLDVSGGQSKPEAYVYIQATTGKVTLNRKIYPLKGEILISVEDPDLNLHPKLKEKITAKSRRLFIKTTDHPQPLYLTAEEIEPDLGIFQAKVTLNRDIPATYRSSVVVCYVDEATAEGKTDVPIMVKAWVKQNTAILTFNKLVYAVDEEEAKLTLIDPDVNKNPDLVDYVDVTVKSNRDITGKKVTLLETEPNSGKFEGIVRFTGKSRFVQGYLMVKSCDRITAEYIDYDANPSHIINWTEGKLTILKVVAKAKIVPKIGLPIILSPPKLLDRKGGVVMEAKTGELLLIQAELKNTWKIRLPVTCIFQVKNIVGEKVYMGWVKSRVEAEKSQTLGLSWIPKKPGIYIIEIYVWKSLEEPEPLSAPSTLALKVLPSQEYG